MRDVDKARAQAEAKRAATAAGNGYRPGIWAGLARYLAAEAEREHTHAEQDRERDAAEERPDEPGR